jgi:pilus assembly protein CpaF
VIVHTTRLADGTRKIVQVSEVTGMLDETHIGLKDIFEFKQTGIDSQHKVLGQFRATGYIPTFMEDIKIRGIALAESIFAASK